MEVILVNKLKAITTFGDQIIKEFDPTKLEFKDFSSYQDKYIKEEKRGYSIHKDEYDVADEGDRGWAIAPLYYGGKPYARNADIMPKTTKILTYVGYTSYAGITSLNPDFGLDWHTDDYGGISPKHMRYFYTLKTDGMTYLDVEGEERQYFKEREQILFQPKRRHRVWNEGKEPRYSLVIDVW